MISQINKIDKSLHYLAVAFFIASWWVNGYLGIAIYVAGLTIWFIARLIRHNQVREVHLIYWLLVWWRLRRAIKAVEAYLKVVEHD